MPFINRSPLEYQVNTSSSLRRCSFNRAPTVADYKQYKVSDEWLDTSSNDWWKLCYRDQTQGIWRKMCGTAGAAETFIPDAGVSPVVPDAANEITLVGGNNVTITGGLNQWTTDITGTTDHAVQLGNATGSLSSSGLGLTGQLFSGVTGADPTWTTSTFPLTCAIGDVIYGSALNVFSNLAFDATATRYLSNTGGGATIPAWSQIELTNGVTGILPVPNGGTGVATITDGALIVGSGVGAVTDLGAMVNGTLAIGSTGADPVISTLTAGAGIAITNAAGSITIAATGSGLAWIDATAATYNMAVATAYGCNRGAGVAFTLPGTAAQGTVMEIVGILGLWNIVQGAGQSIEVGMFTSTVGAGGSLTATNLGDCIVLRCITADTVFRVQNMIGNPAIV